MSSLNCVNEDYNCNPLQLCADFEIPIARNVFWVPVNTLGGTRYTNNEIQQMLPLSPEEK